MARNLALGSLAALGALAATVGLVACGASTTNEAGDRDAGAHGGTLPCAVEAIVEASCRRCHGATPLYGAPMSLVTASDFRARSSSDPERTVAELVPLRIANDSFPMPPAPNARLSQTDRDTLTNWVQAGATASSEACTTPSKDGGPTDPGITCTPDLVIAPASPYELPTSSGDQYVCYGVDLKPNDPTHIVAFSPKIDNATITHHIVLFEAEESFGTTPTPCGAGGSIGWRMVMAWAPGGKGLELPPEVGFPLSTSGTHYIVQMHYSNPQHLSGQKDSSGFSFCTSSPRKYEADVLAFGTMTLDIPPQSPHSTTCSIKVASNLANTHLIAAMPHMHKLGKSMSTKLVPAAGGPEVDLGTVANFSFETQPWLPLDVRVQTNDVIRTTCSYVNDTPSPVGFGEKTADEMCYSFTMYYPKVSSGFWSWTLPAATSSCE